MTTGNFEETHANILKSGLDAFLEEGYEKANLRRICKSAGVTTGAFYKHFTDKEDLFAKLVEPLADKINEIYNYCEKESFSTYGTEFPVPKEKILKVLELKQEGTLKSVEFFYAHKDIFELLIFKSYGTKYEHFLDKLIEIEDRNDWSILEMIHGKENADSIMTKQSVHIINHAFFNAISELVVHASDKEQLLSMAKTMSNFFNAGWEKYRSP